ncbi:MAG: 2-oxoacid:acceptor oxidoreductase subunit alpha [Myxococcales bacterium]|nr:2-oxoacid:acceptor oxidoreductase subunit alpha [Myxococcales bacterium]
MESSTTGTSNPGNIGSPTPVTPANGTEVEKVVVRFAGDSGDGMQLTGNEFTKAAALAGNDISTFPDFPAEIRAPAGSIAGVSGFQLHFSSTDIHTPGDAPDVLIAMNPAALKANIGDLQLGGTLLINTGAFTKPNVAKAGYESNPLDDEAQLKNYEVHLVDINKLVNTALEETGLTSKEKGRCKNFFALGLMCWRYQRDAQPQIDNILAKFKKRPAVGEANVLAFKAGYNYGLTAEVFQATYKVKPASFEPGRYRNITGNEAVALGMVAAGQLAECPVVFSGYPITPASTVFHYLSNYKNYGVTTFQAEDEIAGIGAAIGASYGGAIGVTASSGPGIALKGEAIGLAQIVELPLVIISVQRGGPSTGLPTKTEQSDLYQSLFGRNGECPLPIIAAKTPTDAFYCAIEATRLATKYMTPVILLSDGYIANGAEPWKLPEVDDLEPFPVKHLKDAEGWMPYKRDEETLARSWVVPGTKGMAHRVGGLEKDFLTGNVSYDPENHERMCKIREDKIMGISKDYGDFDIEGEESGDVLIIGWGGTHGALRQAVGVLREDGKSVSHLQIRHMWPLNPKLGDLMKNFNKILVCELNMGQLLMVLRSEYLVDATGYNKMQGKPFTVAEICNAVTELV